LELRTAPARNQYRWKVEKARNGKRFVRATNAMPSVSAGVPPLRPDARERWFIMGRNARLVLSSLAPRLARERHPREAI
jgi:hypothetical protein